MKWLQQLGQNILGFFQTLYETKLFELDDDTLIGLISCQFIDFSLTYYLDRVCWIPKPRARLFRWQT